MADEGAVRFGVVGLEHPHVLAQVALLEAAGGVLAGRVPGDGGPGDLSEGFGRLRPEAPRYPTLDELPGEPEAALGVGAPAPEERAELGIRALRAGRHVLGDKPGAIRLPEVDRIREAVQASGRHGWGFVSEHLTSPATLRAEARLRGGALGETGHRIALGPHRIGPAPGSLSRGRVRPCPRSSGPGRRGPAPPGRGGWGPPPGRGPGRDATLRPPRAGGRRPRRRAR